MRRRGRGPEETRYRRRDFRCRGAPPVDRALYDDARPASSRRSRRGPFRRCSEVEGPCSQLIDGLRPPIGRCLATDTARPPYFYRRVDLLLIVEARQRWSPVTFMAISRASVPIPLTDERWAHINRCAASSRTTTSCSGMTASLVGVTVLHASTSRRVLRKTRFGLEGSLPPRYSAAVAADRVCDEHEAAEPDAPSRCRSWCRSRREMKRRSAKLIEVQNLAKTSVLADHPAQIKVLGVRFHPFPKLDVAGSTPVAALEGNKGGGVRSGCRRRR